MLLKKINNDANTRFFSLLALTLVILPRLFFNFTYATYTGQTHKQLKE